MFNLFYNYKFDYLRIYDSLKHFYPIGLKKGPDRMFYSYPGLVELSDIIIENIHENDNFIARWVGFTKQIENTIQKEIIGTTYGQAPSFSAYVRLDSFSIDNFTREKEIHFFVSLVGPFYTVIGQDNSITKIGSKVFRKTNYLVVSPEAEFAEIFNFLCDQIEKRFQGFRFVPFFICNQTIEGLYVTYDHYDKNSVFHGIFNDQIELNAQTLGSESFKSSEWIREDYVDRGDKWTIYPPEKE